MRDSVPNDRIRAIFYAGSLAGDPHDLRHRIG
jgi:hypothetical protein